MMTANKMLLITLSKGGEKKLMLRDIVVQYLKRKNNVIYFSSWPLSSVKSEFS